MSNQKTCLGISCSSLVILFTATLVCVFVSFVQFIDEITKPIHPQPTGEAFFEAMKVSDVYRIALIEPYDATSTGKGWFVTLKNHNMKYQSLVGAKKLDVIHKQVIITYETVPNAILNGEVFKEVWFVIIPEKHIEEGFTNEADFLAYLKANGIDKPDLRDTNEIYKELVTTGTLKWYPKP